MKGGKGGQGRKRSSVRAVDKASPRTSIKKGEPKRDWGAVPRDDTTLHEKSAYRSTRNGPTVRR